ncbi:hypothetical protein [Pelagicoccus albus]|uniref:Uncharacterized protein n=1 Tax=Pelagicoccus albus TaxID=415222 RepID=A0A7X1E748_9BACT|nr:hypothetical protein [Pelagicoccus albus]MBC2605360.1 hypothetical protein [Pelagicoccus albus]
MLKERVVKKSCNAVHGEVTLEIASSENDNTGYESVSMIKDCDSCHKCGVKTESGMHWSRCVFYGKAL